MKFFKFYRFRKIFQVADEKPDRRSVPTENLGGIAGALARALAERRKDIEMSGKIKQNLNIIFNYICKLIVNNHENFFCIVYR